MRLRAGLHLAVVHVAGVHQLGPEPAGVRGRLPQRAPRPARLAGKYCASWRAYDSYTTASMRLILFGLHYEYLYYDTSLIVKGVKCSPS